MSSQVKNYRLTVILAATLSLLGTASARAQFCGPAEADETTCEPAHEDDELNYEWYDVNNLLDVYYSGDAEDPDLVGVPAVEVCAVAELRSVAGPRRAGDAAFPAPACPGAEEYQTRLHFYKFKMSWTARLTEHSATRVIRVKRRQQADGSWTIVSAEVTNHPNHGRGPSSPGGVRYRSVSTNWTDATGKGFTTYDAVAGKKCVTAYGFTAPNHVCHGDTQFQFDSYSRHIANLAPPNAAGGVCNQGIIAGGQAP